MKNTIRRDILMGWVKAGRVVSTASRHFDDMHGEERRETEIPCRFSTGSGDFIQGQCNLRQSDFTTKSGLAYWENKERGEISLIVHGNSSYDLKLKP